jgi:hypothetical protein
MRREIEGRKNKFLPRVHSFSKADKTAHWPVPKFPIPHPCQLKNREFTSQ